MLNRERLADGTELLGREQARVIVATPKPGIVVIVASGTGDTVVDDAVFELLEAEAARSGPLKIFVDMTALSRMAGESREKALTWGRSHRALVQVTHLLIRSKVLEMAFSVIGMLVGGRFKMYSNPDEFHAHLRAEVPGFRAPRPQRVEQPRIASPK
jgi:hypothetical protein